jgi:hypothetical protein
MPVILPYVILSIPPNVTLSIPPNVILSGVEGWRTLWADTGYKPDSRAMCGSVMERSPTRLHLYSDSNSFVCVFSSVA